MSFHRRWWVAPSRYRNSLQRQAPLVVIAGVALSANAFAGFPTLYGKIYLTANQYDLEKLDFAPLPPPATGFRHSGAIGTTQELKTTALESTGSRLGIQGDFDANADITLFYRLE